MVQIRNLSLHQSRGSNKCLLLRSDLKPSVGVNLFSCYFFSWYGCASCHILPHLFFNHSAFCRSYKQKQDHSRGDSLYYQNPESSVFTKARSRNGGDKETNIRTYPPSFYLAFLLARPLEHLVRLPCCYC